MQLDKNEFGDDFYWGISSSAFQTEGTFPYDGRGDSIWDQFSQKKGNIKKGHTAEQATLFYKYFRQDIGFIKWMNLRNFRFSISWPRVIPNGTGKWNQQGIDFYDRLIDECLENGISPWVTLYHWDLPHALEEKGGWTNRDVVNYFQDYLELCMQKYADRVDRWMVLNEPTAFTALGYFLGIHAPGKKGKSNFLPSIHHAALAQAEGGRLIRSHDSNLKVGTTFSFSHVEAHRNRQKDVNASNKVDAILNRLYLEPLLGMGYPIDELPFLEGLASYVQNGDMQKLSFDMDFIGVQNYSREVVAHSYFTPIVNAKLVPPKKRGKPRTAMNWEIYPESIYHVLNRLNTYDNIPPLVITENGAAFEDKLQSNGRVEDEQRIDFLREHIGSVKKAIKDGIKVDGYFVWSLTDNFEWAEGYRPRFGLIYVDYEKLSRIPKKSAFWYRDFLSDN
ncbi:MAG: beta-glucosidase [Flavobacteriales bacterium]|nr:beta-glucosidase [Flavobacteriales bacterium]|tara:strand:+ start:676 stop:2019 length:1344 start_codon:yes stop_codon:yes gene_type:complete